MSDGSETLSRPAMARVDVSLYGFVHDVADRTRITLDVPQHSSLREVIGKLVAAEGDRLRERLMAEAGSLQPGVQVFVNGERAGSLDDHISESDIVRVKIVVLNAAAGG